MSTSHSCGTMEAKVTLPKSKEFAKELVNYSTCTKSSSYGALLCEARKSPLNGGDRAHDEGLPEHSKAIREAKNESGSHDPVKNKASDIVMRAAQSSVART